MEGVEQCDFLTPPCGGAQKNERWGALVGGVGKAGLVKPLVALGGGESWADGDVELQVAGELYPLFGDPLEGAEAMLIGFTTGEDCGKVLKERAGKASETVMAAEGAVGEAGIDEADGDPAAAGLLKMFRPEFALGEDEQIRLEALEGACAARPEIERENALPCGEFAEALPEEGKARAGGGGEDDFERIVLPELFEEAFNGQ